MGDRRWPNNDGVDFVDCSDVLVQNTTISTGDDAICITGHVSNSTSHNIHVRNCTIESAAMKVAVFDPVASGAISDVTFEDIRVIDTNRGAAVQPRSGATDILNITFR
eukprot:TRINITY_DN1763_c0_g1_i6.p2 TRINITY_DN1763_c0_g1~~TRINITY_DN1763_c0_g1_i6.p2  ORF type:complete len:108 (+),score=20.33 TRINITY_DN1763_c0_g1_i6:109-432(+)